jgi:hypothetical protein
VGDLPIAREIQFDRLSQALSGASSGNGRLPPALLTRIST